MAHGPHHAHPALPCEEQPTLTLRFGGRSLAGIALWTALLDPGDEVLIIQGPGIIEGTGIVGGTGSWLAPLAELVGGHPSTVAVDALWSEIGERTRAVVLRADEELLLLLSETDVVPIVVLEPGAALNDARAIGIDGSTLRVGGRVGAALRSTLVHHAELARAADDMEGRR